MSRPVSVRIFQSNAPLLTWLSGSALLIMASDRLAHAIIAVGALVWVYGFSSLAAHAGARFFPWRGRTVLLAFLTSFIAGIYLLLLWILSPFCALESFFVISLIPMFCISSAIFDQVEFWQVKSRQMESQSLYDTFFEALTESIILGAPIIIFALIREPLGFLSLSLPGGVRGIILLFSFTAESFFPIHLIASSSGALLLLGYFLGLYRYFKAQYAPREDKDGF